jgi:hypothetical protein
MCQQHMFLVVAVFWSAAVGFGCRRRLAIAQEGRHMLSTRSHHLDDAFYRFTTHHVLFISQVPFLAVHPYLHALGSSDT